MINLILFGPPGAGKGTQSAKIIEKYSLTRISTGDLFRKHLKEGTPLGKLAREYMDKGNLVPDQVVIDMVDDKIQSSGKIEGIIFDGFPRTLPQAEALDNLLAKNNTPIKNERRSSSLTLVSKGAFGPPCFFMYLRACWYLLEATS